MATVVANIMTRLSSPNVEEINAPKAGLVIRLRANVAVTHPYAKLRSCSSVISATYANITEKVTENIPDTTTKPKYNLKQKKYIRIILKIK